MRGQEEESPVLLVRERSIISEGYSICLFHNRSMSPIRGHSQTMLTRFCPLLIHHLPNPCWNLWGKNCISTDHISSTTYLTWLAYIACELFHWSSDKQKCARNLPYFSVKRTYWYFWFYPNYSKHCIEMLNSNYLDKSIRFK